MSGRGGAVSNPALISEETVKDTLHRVIRQEAFVRKRFTIEQIAEESGVNIHTVRSYIKNDSGERSEPSLSNFLSIAVVLGPRTVNAVLALIGYSGAKPLDEMEASGPAKDAAEMLENVSKIVRAAADNIIDHTEEADTAAAADNVIDLAMPYSSRGRAQ